MKTIGLLGGMTWSSSIEYYKLINQLVQQKLGKSHSAKIVLRSVDYQNIKQYNYQNWEAIGEILFNELQHLGSYDVDCMLLCNNTLHKSYDDIQGKLSHIPPVFHIIDCLIEEIHKRKYKKVLLLGTKFVMESDFYRIKLHNAKIQSITPNESERNILQTIITEELGKNSINPASQEFLKEIITSHKDDVEAVVLACTELPLVIRPEQSSLPLLNTLEIHCLKAVEFALS